MQVPCPCCGSRPLAEFTYGGAVVARPGPDAAAGRDEDWQAFVYLRDNPAGPYEEWWFHAAACRRWFAATRDTLSNRFLNPGDGA